MKLIAIDLDGTLLSKDGNISDRNIQVIKQAQQEGHKIAACSGRSHKDIKQILQNNRIEAAIISGNGAMVYDEIFISQLYFDKESLKELVNHLEKNQVFTEMYTEEGIVISKEGVSRLYEELDELIERRKAPISRELYEYKISKILNQKPIFLIQSFKEFEWENAKSYKVSGVSYLPEKQDRIAKIAEESTLSVTSGSEGIFEFGNPHSSKGYGLRSLANHLNIPLEETVAIGDNFNDISMFKIAGTSIAMGNAVKEVKEIATYVTEDFDHDGVAIALEKYILNQ